MRFPLLTCAVLAACGGDDPVGITIEIAPIPGVETVELFVAKAVFSGTSGPPGVAPMTAKLYEVPNDRTGPSIVDASSAFLLVNDTAETQLIEMFAALGYDKEGNVVAAYKHAKTILVVPGQTELWRIELSPATDIVPGTLSPEDGDFRARRWTRSDETMPSCAIIEHNGERFAFGPVGDRDCDEHTRDDDTSECAPWIFLADATAPTGFISATCGTKQTFAPGYPQACMASGYVCSEVGSTDQTCTKLTQDFCVTPLLCDQCATWDRNCLAMKLAQPSFPPAVSYIRCSVCSARAEYVGVHLAGLLGASPSTCNDVRIHEIGATLGPLGDTATFQTGSLKITDSTESCSVDLEWNGTPASSADLAFVALDVGTIGNPKHVVVPLYIQYACDSNGQVCTAVPVDADPIRLCAQPPAATDCGADAICSNGRWCGEKCCGIGEQCGPNNTCVCGTTNASCDVGLVCAEGMTPAERCGSACCSSSGGTACI